MTAFAPTVEICEVTFTQVNPRFEIIAPRMPDRSIPSRLEAGLDRLLNDIERLEETERWDGMS